MWSPRIPQHNGGHHDPDNSGAPSDGDGGRLSRAALAAAATISLGFGILGLLFVLVGGIGPADRGLWIGLVILFAFAAIGHHWRADAPGGRDPNLERERRGF